MRKGYIAPTASDRIRFSIQGPGEIAATDNGDATEMTSFASHERNAFNGLCLVIVRGVRGRTGEAVLRVDADGLSSAHVALRGTEAVKSMPHDK